MFRKNTPKKKNNRPAAGKRNAAPAEDGLYYDSYADDYDRLYSREQFPEDEAVGESYEETYSAYGESGYGDDYPEDSYYDDDYPEDDYAHVSRGKKSSGAKKSRRKKAVSDGWRKLKITLIVLLCLLIVLSAAVTAAAYYVSHLDTSFPNLLVDGVSVGNMSGPQVIQALDASGWDEKSAVPLKVELMGRSEFEIDQCASGARFTKDAAAEAVMAFGHGDNWYLNLLQYLQCMLGPQDINDYSLVHNREYVLSQIDSAIEALNEQLGDGSYTVDEEASVLRMVKGAGQLSFDREDMADAIFAALTEDITNISYDSLASKPKAPDFQAIFQELSAEPVDASFSDDNRFTVIDHVVGCDFDPEEARDIWNNAENAADVEIPIEISLPEVTSEYLSSLLFRDVLGSVTTYYKNSIDNRISNVNLAASKINGLILYPGDVFSYNDTIGQRTEAAGFLPAGAYDNGEVVEEVGGGICQVSSTLYNAMLYGYGLTTVERSPHYFPVDYLEKGYDATVSWAKPDFKFKNETAYPVKIVAVCDNEERSLTVSIMGTNLDGYSIQLTKTTAAYNNSKYPWLHEGWGVQVFRHVYDANGIEVGVIQEIYDVYHTHEFAEQMKALEAQAAAMAAAGQVPAIY